MSEPNLQRVKTEGGRFELRCPACASVVRLPAEVCNRCGADLKTGFISEDNEDGGRKKLILGLVTLGLVLGLAALFFSLSSSDQPVAATEAADDGSLSSALESVQGAINDRPVFNYGPVLDQTRNIADQAGQKRLAPDEVVAEEQP